MIRFFVLTLFPEAVKPYLESSMLWKAQDRKKISIKVINPRDFSRDKHKKADDRPYGGGPGMVLTAQPLLDAVAALKSKCKVQKAKFQFKTKNTKIVILSPRGKQFTNKLATDWAKNYRDIILISGHYEGIDARVKKILRAEEISVGPYTLTGGELPAMIIVDAVTRQIPGVLGHEHSLEKSRISTGEVYTRPEILVWPIDSARGKQKKYRVPKVLLSGHQKNIEEWKLSRG